MSTFLNDAENSPNPELNQVDLDAKSAQLLAEQEALDAKNQEVIGAVLDYIDQVECEGRQIAAAADGAIATDLDALTASVDTLLGDSGVTAAIVAEWTAFKAELDADNNGTITLSDFENLFVKLSDYSTKIDEYEGRVSANEQAVSDIQAEVTSFKAEERDARALQDIAISSNETEINAIKAKQAIDEANITANAADAAAAIADAAAADAKAVAADAKAVAAQAAAVAAQAAADAAQADADAAASAASDADIKAQGAHDRLDVLEPEVNIYKTKVNNIEIDIDIERTRILNLENNITNIINGNTIVGLTEAQVVALIDANPNIDAAQVIAIAEAKVSELAKKVDNNLLANISLVQAEISSIQACVASKSALLLSIQNRTLDCSAPSGGASGDAI